MSRNHGILNKRHFHKGEKVNNLSGTRVHHRHGARLLLAHFLVGCKMLAQDFGDWCSWSAVGSLTSEVDRASATLTERVAEVERVAQAQSASPQLQLNRTYLSRRILHD